MKKSRFSESQIVAILKEVELGTKVGETCRKHGIRDSLYYKWKSQYAGMSVSHLVVDGLMMAVWPRGKPLALLHHSDQGSQYTSEHFQQLIKEQGITCSMSRAGEVWDSSAMESFFSSLKTERTARTVYRTREQARADVLDYIERFYNPTRRRWSCDFMSDALWSGRRFRTFNVIDRFNRTRA